MLSATAVPQGNNQSKHNPDENSRGEPQWGTFMTAAVEASFKTKPHPKPFGLKPWREPRLSHSLSPTKTYTFNFQPLALGAKGWTPNPTLNTKSETQNPELAALPSLAFCERTLHVCGGIAGRFRMCSPKQKERDFKAQPWSWCQDQWPSTKSGRISHDAETWPPISSEGSQPWMTMHGFPSWQLGQLGVIAASS